MQLPTMSARARATALMLLAAALEIRRKATLPVLVLGIPRVGRETARRAAPVR